MQRDEPSFPLQPSSATSAVAPSRSAPARKRSWARRSALGALVLATSLAVASYASTWLVPPYLALMAWLLWPPADRRARATAAAVPDPSALIRTVGPDEGLVEGAAAPWDDATPSDAFPDPGAAAEADNAPATTALKSRRGRTRGRKAKPAPAAEPATHVTWIRVGPGKFVRVEGANAAVTDDAPNAEAERAPAEVAPERPPSTAAVPPDDAEADPAHAGEAEPVAGTETVEPDAGGAAEADLAAAPAVEPPPAPEEAWPPDAPEADDMAEVAPVEAADHRQPPPVCSDEVSESPEVACMDSASYADDPETPAPTDDAAECVGAGPEPEAAVDPVDVPAEEDGPAPDVPAAEYAGAGLRPDAYAGLDVAPSPAPTLPANPDGPSIDSAGRALWVALREAFPRLTRPLRSVVEHSPSRRTPRAGRRGRVVTVCRRRPRRRRARGLWRALRARSPPADDTPVHTGPRTNPARIGLLPVPAGFASLSAA